MAYDRTPAIPCRITLVRLRAWREIGNELAHHRIWHWSASLVHLFGPDIKRFVSHFLAFHAAVKNYRQFPTVAAFTRPSDSQRSAFKLFKTKRCHVNFSK